MNLYPLALLPQVTVADGQAQLPFVPGSPVEYGTPEQAIAAWVEQGASWVHVVDQDPGTTNYASIAAGTGAHVQLASAIDSEPELQAALHAAPSRIVIEPTDLTWTQNALAAHGGLLAVALDLGQADAFDVRVTLDQAGCTRYVVTAAHRHLLKQFCEQTASAVVADVSVHNLDDLHELHELVPDGLDGIILNKPLYNGAFMYAEAVAAGADRFDMFFWGPPQP